MAAVWAQGEATVRSVTEAVAEDGPRSYTTILTVMTRLDRKGFLDRRREGKRDVYWTGPSLGFDLGGNASKTFVLVYNLYDSQNLYKRFAAGEGAAYLVGGFNASYLRRGNVVLIPIRLGVGYRLGVNAGYMKFTEKRNWLPF